MELPFLSIGEASGLIKKGEISPVELTESVLDRVSRLDGELNTYITVMGEKAIDAAKTAEKEISSGKYRGPLHGIPIGLKDIFVMKGVPATCGSKMLENFIPPYDAAVTKKILDAGAVIVGKNNMDEFAMGSSTETSYFGPTKNPWDKGRVPGGSSGGSAAATAASLCLGSIGTDTGGSIRQPASFCGVVGMKPTYGRVSRFGMIAFASSLDQAGPITKTVEDAAIILNVISGHDPMDSTCVNTQAPDYTLSLRDDIKGVKVGVPREYFIPGMDKEVEEAAKKAIALVEDLGGEIVEISLPHTEYAVITYYIIAPSEASSNLARYDGVKYGYRTANAETLRDMYFKTRAEGFGSEVKRRIMLGTYALSAGYYDAYYLKAQRVRTLIKKDFDDAFKKVDVIMAPTAPEVAFRFGEKTGDPIKMYLSDVLTIPCNIAGLPGISVPCGFSSDGLPIGIQVLGKPFDECSVIHVAHAYEQRAGWRDRKPDI
ncbi:MAG TPA: Asp-tRNA(Asn)/Glu-tRNA(Gln) amidotransferase subunit GatA [Thermodesulfobacteriota bacterium]|nr:Asp-tRNA(Asn)/Glu-tRNA(Gln) amidotransferase subunit GatA [Thermodesulfobacteriota bacterium]